MQTRFLGPGSCSFPLLRPFALALAFVGLVRAPAAQSHYGQEFWLADTYSSASSGFTIAIANPSSVVANVVLINTIEGSTFDVVAPGSIKLFTFPEHDLGIQGNVISTDPVYHVEADIDVAVFLFDPLQNEAHNDAALVLPVAALGERYRVANWVNPDNSAGQFVAVVAVTPGTLTNVQVIDATETVVDNVNLLQGQVFQRINHINVGATPADDMTGWEIVADQPVAVFSGSNITSIGTPFNAGDFIVEQLLDERRLTKAYAVAPLGTRPLGCTTPATCAADVFRFVATEDNTTLVTVPNVGGGTINEGDYLELATAEPFVITANEPFFGYRYLPSNDALFAPHPAAGYGDPALLDLIPVEQHRKDYIFHAEGDFPDNFANIVAPVGATLFLDNSLITATCDPIGTIAGKSYCSIRLPVASGTHTAHSTDEAFGLVVSGFQTFSSYAYPAGLGNPCVQGPDGWLRDTVADVGNEPHLTSSPLWESPDIWVRTQQDTLLQFQHQHQNPIASAVNWVYVKLRNRGCAPLREGDVFVHYAKASTGLAWPANWVGNPPNGDVVGSQPVSFLASNGELVLEFPWTPPAPGHFCLLARLVSPDDPMTFPEVLDVNTNTFQNNNIVWKNLNVLGGFSLQKAKFIVRNIRPAPATLELAFEGGLPPGPPGFALAGPVRPLPRGSVLVRLPPALYAAWQAGGALQQGLEPVAGTTYLRITAPLARLQNIPFALAEAHTVCLLFDHTLGLSDPPGPFLVRQSSDVGGTGTLELDGGISYVFE